MVATDNWKKLKMIVSNKVIVKQVIVISIITKRRKAYMNKIMRFLTTALLSLSFCLVCGTQSGLAASVPIDYSFGTVYQGKATQDANYYYATYFNISTNTNQHIFIDVNTSSRVNFRVDIFNESGNIVSSDSSSIKTVNDAKTNRNTKHSVNLQAGKYQIRVGGPNTNWATQFSFIATAEPIISLGTVNISDITIPEWGTADVSFSPISNALGYETQVCSDISFSNPQKINSAEPSVTVSGLTNRINYVKTRAYAAYSDGNKVYSGWSQPRTIAFPKLSNPLKIKAKMASVKHTKLKKRTQTLSVSKVINFINKGKGSLVYTKASGNKKISINKKTGKVTVKKGLKRGIYKVKVKVKAAGNSDYKPSSVKTVTFKIKVK